MKAPPFPGGRREEGFRNLARRPGSRRAARENALSAWSVHGLFKAAGAGNRVRTCDLLITNQPLCLLSYASGMEQAAGIEPAFPAWEAGVLPIDDACGEPLGRFRLRGLAEMERKKNGFRAYAFTDKGSWPKQQDSDLRPPRPERGALPAELCLDVPRFSRGLNGRYKKYEKAGFRVSPAWTEQRDSNPRRSLPVMSFRRDALPPELCSDIRRDRACPEPPNALKGIIMIEPTMRGWGAERDSNPRPAGY